MVVYPQPAAKNKRPAWGPSQEQKGLNEKSLMALLVARSPLVTPSTPAVRAHVVCSGPLPVPLPTTPVGSHPRRLWPGWHTKQQHFAQRPDMVSQPRHHGGRTGLPLLRGAAAVGAFGLRQ